MSGMATYYHTTDAAEAILANGFRDATGSYGFVNFELTGVFLADMPVDVNEGAKGEQVLRVEVPDDVDLAEYGLIEEGGTAASGRPEGSYREWCVPAALVNTHATVTLMSEAEVDELTAERFRHMREVIEGTQAP
jgi:hypothetical protein